MTNKEEKVVGKALRVEMGENENEGTVGAKSNHRPTEEQMCPFLVVCERAIPRRRAELWLGSSEEEDSWGKGAPPSFPAFLEEPMTR